MAPKQPPQKETKKRSTAVKILIGCFTAIAVYLLFYLFFMVFVMKLDVAEMLDHLRLQKSPWKPVEILTGAERLVRKEQWREHNRRLAIIQEQPTGWLVRDADDICRGWSLNEYESRVTWRIAPRGRAIIQVDSTQVTCWPSSGGFWTTHLDAVDLDFLGLYRLSDTPRSSDPGEEDKFCTSLSRFGPTWYKDEEWYHYCMTGDYERLGCIYPDDCPPPTIPKPPAFYSYPSKGGLWVLQLARRGQLMRSGMGKLRNVFTMEEKADVIEMLGGRYFAEPQDYWSLQDEESVFV